MTRAAWRLIVGASLALAIVPTVRAQGGWRLSVRRSPMTDRSSVAVTLRATRPTVGVLGQPYTPSLALWCEDEQLHIYITTGLVLDETYRIRWDGMDAETGAGSVSRDGTALFFRDGPEFVLRHLLRARRLRLEFQPHFSAPQIAEFNVSGLRFYSRRLLEACPDWGLRKQCASALEEPHTLVTGLVVDSTGRPISEAIIDGPYGCGAITDGAGRFVVPVPTGPAIRLNIRALGYPLQEVLMDLTPAVRDRSITITMTTRPPE